MSPAETWDSYYPTLVKVLRECKPKKVLEWGSGRSTPFIASVVESIDTVEHNPEWYGRIPNRDNIYPILEPDLDLYPLTTGRYDKYDFIFVDGRQRVKCLKTSVGCLNDNGVVILHDSGRKKYKEGIDVYKHSIYTDSGHTVTLTNNDGMYKALREKFNNHDELEVI